MFAKSKETLQSLLHDIDFFVEKGVQKLILRVRRQTL